MNYGMSRIVACSDEDVDLSYVLITMGADTTDKEVPQDQDIKSGAQKEVLKNGGVCVECAQNLESCGGGLGEEQWGGGRIWLFGRGRARWSG